MPGSVATQSKEGITHVKRFRVLSFRVALNKKARAQISLEFPLMCSVLDSNTLQTAGKHPGGLNGFSLTER